MHYILCLAVSKPPKLILHALSEKYRCSERVWRERRRKARTSGFYRPAKTPCGAAWYANAE